jgi:hypothetical protein
MARRILPALVTGLALFAGACGDLTTTTTAAPTESATVLNTSQQTVLVGFGTPARRR